MDWSLRLKFPGALYPFTEIDKVRSNATLTLLNRVLNDGVKSCILHVSLFKLCLFYSYLVYEIYNA
jgi:hypothetical protein